MSGTTDLTLLHLKMDRLLAGQAEVREAVVQNDATTAALVAGCEHLQVAIGTLTEMTAKLAESMSREAEGMEMRDLIIRIEAHLTKIRDDGARTVTMLTRLPPTLQRAAEDGVRMAMGGAIDLDGAAP